MSAWVGEQLSWLFGNRLSGDVEPLTKVEKLITIFFLLIPDFMVALTRKNTTAHVMRGALNPAAQLGEQL